MSNNGRSITEHEVRILAYELWEKAGKPHGHDRHFWLIAEQTLHAKLLSMPKGKPKWAKKKKK